MADEPNTPPGSPSGSRWEPDPDETPTTEAPAAAPTAERSAGPGPDTGPAAPRAADHLYGAAGATPAARLHDTAAEERRAKLRGRGVLAGAATALALGGGLTGFVIGHATAGGDDVRPANFSGQGPGGQFGGQPGQGQPPPASFGDRDGDGYDGRPDRDDDSTGSGTGSSSDSGSGTTGNSSGTAANPT